jgi:outer membrane receptor for ferrienterochelin and colicin
MRDFFLKTYIIMKKLFLVGALALFGAMNAQVNFGAKGGLTVAHLTAEYDGETGNSDSKISPYIGLTMEVPMSQNLKFQAEALYTVLGGTDDTDGIKSEFKIPELIIPLSLKYQTNEKFYIQGGLNLGFITSPKVSQESVEVKADEIFKSFDLGILLGLGYRIAPKLDLDARFNVGASNVSDFGEGIKMRNNYWQVGLNYWFK